MARLSGTLVASYKARRFIRKKTTDLALYRRRSTRYHRAKPPPIYYRTGKLTRAALQGAAT